MRDRREIKKSIIKWLIIFAVMVIVYFWKQELIDNAIGEMRDVPSLSLSLCFVMTFLYFVTEGLIISSMTRREEKKLPLTKGFLCGLFCAFYRLVTLGSGSGFAEIYYYNCNGVPVSNGTGMTLVQYTFQKISIGIFGIISFIFLFAKGQEGITDYAVYMLLGSLVITAIVVFLILIAVSEKLAKLVLLLAEKFMKEGTRFHSKLGTVRTNIINFNRVGREIWSHKGHFLFIVILNFIKFVCWYSIPGILLTQEFAVTIPECIAVMAVVNMISCVMVTPSGIGALEFIFILLFGAVVPEQNATAALILYRFFTWILPFLVGAVIAGFHRRKSE